MSSFAVFGRRVCVRQGVLSGRRDGLDSREFPREVRASEGGSDNADSGSLVLSAAFRGSGEGPCQRGWEVGSGLSWRKGGDWS